MPVYDSFAIIAFRSRQHALHFNKMLSADGYVTHIMTTPVEIAAGCGLSVKFSPSLAPKVIQAYKSFNVPIVGVFLVRREGGKMKFSRIPY